MGINREQHSIDTLFLKVMILSTADLKTFLEKVTWCTIVQVPFIYKVSYEVLATK